MDFLRKHRAVLLILALYPLAVYAGIYVVLSGALVWGWW